VGVECLVAIRASRLPVGLWTVAPARTCRSL